jgi:5-carboxymethyl-2-hydroxymuconate isomerase
MPHITIEYSANVADLTDIQALVEAVHASAVASAIAPADWIRTRATSVEHFVIADGKPENTFVAVVVRLAPGRSIAERKRLVDDLFDSVNGHFDSAGRAMIISVECQDIDSDLRRSTNDLLPPLPPTPSTG